MPAFAFSGIVLAAVIGSERWTGMAFESRNRSLTNGLRDLNISPLKNIRGEDGMSQGTGKIPKNEPKKRPGRPLKYMPFFFLLKDDELYSPALIVRTGEGKGLFTGLSKDKQEETRLKTRHTLSAFSKNHKFPQLGDGMVSIPQRPLTVGWWGWRWKKAAGIQITKEPGK